MRSFVPVLACLVIAGCGGGGSVSPSALSQTGPSKTAPMLPTNTTTYVGTLSQSGGGFQLGQVTTVINPNGTFTMTCTNQITINVSGNISIPPESSQGSLTLNAIPSASGKFWTYPMNTAVVYSGGGAISWPTTSTIAGSIAFAANGQGSGTMLFTGTAQ